MRIRIRATATLLVFVAIFLVGGWVFSGLGNYLSLLTNVEKATDVVEYEYIRPVKRRIPHGGEFWWQARSERKIAPFDIRWHETIECDYGRTAKRHWGYWAFVKSARRYYTTGVFGGIGEFPSMLESGKVVRAPMRDAICRMVSLMEIDVGFGIDPFWIAVPSEPVAVGDWQLMTRNDYAQ